MPGRLTDFMIEICWQKALETGASVLALNVIEAAHPSQSLRDKRSKLNTLIANHEQDRWSVLLLVPFPTCIAKAFPHRYYLDLCSAVPYFALDQKRREDIWDDGVHLTEEGYRLMGEAIAARLVDILSS